MNVNINVDVEILRANIFTIKLRFENINASKLYIQICRLNRIVLKLITQIVCESKIFDTDWNEYK